MGVLKVQRCNNFNDFTKSKYFTVYKIFETIRGNKCLYESYKT